jgi:hypothetical protein
VCENITELRVSGWLAALVLVSTCYLPYESGELTWTPLADQKLALSQYVKPCENKMLISAICQDCWCHFSDTAFWGWNKGSLSLQFKSVTSQVQVGWVHVSLQFMPSPKCLFCYQTWININENADYFHLKKGKSKNWTGTGLLHDHHKKTHFYP